MLAATAYVYSRPQRENHSACLPVSCRWRSHNQAAAGTDKERLITRGVGHYPHKEQRPALSQILPLKQMIHSVLSQLSGEDRSWPPNVQASPF